MTKNIWHLKFSAKDGSAFGRDIWHSRCEAPAPALCKHTVSETISSPFRGAFHLSLTVLVHYRSRKVFSLASIVEADSNRISRVPFYLRKSPYMCDTFRLQGFHLLWLRFPADSPRQATRSPLRGNKPCISYIARIWTWNLTTPSWHMGVHPSAPATRRFKERSHYGFGSSPFALHYLGNGVTAITQMDESIVVIEAK